MRSRWIALLTLLLICCSGCTRVPQKPLNSVITGITVASFQDNGVSLRQFTDDESMMHILNYLRLVKLEGTASTSEAADATTVHSIRLEFADGRRKVYEQTDTDCFHLREAPWKRLDPEYGATLDFLLGSLPAPLPLPKAGA